MQRKEKYDFSIQILLQKWHKMCLFPDVEFKHVPLNVWILKPWNLDYKVTDRLLLPLQAHELRHSHKQQFSVALAILLLFPLNWNLHDPSLEQFNLKEIHMFLVSGFKNWLCQCLRKRKMLCDCHCWIECFSWKFLKLYTCTSTDLKKPDKCQFGIFAPFTLECKKQETYSFFLIYHLILNLLNECWKYDLISYIMKITLLLSHDMSIKVKAHNRWPCCNQSLCGQ